MSRDFGAELDSVSARLAALEELIRSSEGVSGIRPKEERNNLAAVIDAPSPESADCAVYYAGYFRNGGQLIRWEPQEKQSSDLFGLSESLTAKVLSALGHKQRLDILLEVWNEPLSGTELVERLGMGTTGQLYHHLKALTGADLLVQEERGGRYSIPSHRRLPVLLLLAAMSGLIDTSDYIDLTEARDEAHLYLGAVGDNGYDPHLLLWEVVRNSILEHEAGYCTELSIFLHGDHSVTVADNGRGIPVGLLTKTGQPAVQSVMTKLDLFKSPELSFMAPGAKKGITVAVVNALSDSLQVEIRRDGSIHRQEYRHGIPRSEPLMIGRTSETGTSITFTPEPDLFRTTFQREQIEQQVNVLKQSFPSLNIAVYAG
ncbi:winged helix-turn-helix domain-containing protein [Paenibacillus sp. XY044]|uniref:winged helix-turn-helix domain-containing protein n=1 Tax=Paenibacillus sp. XY044 TaxID=2026089 RepID=UPI000B980223|nr:winged helix-turn-helix domain-containing protein [Paenibacillus sp. XY044]OZB96671.1 ArsR family transcriptional regulator [Paenibacillus sp. XY044]